MAIVLSETLLVFSVPILLPLSESGFLMNSCWINCNLRLAMECQNIFSITRECQFSDNLAGFPLVSNVYWMSKQWSRVKACESRSENQVRDYRDRVNERSINIEHWYVKNVGLKDLVCMYRLVLSELGTRLCDVICWGDEIHQTWGDTSLHGLMYTLKLMVSLPAYEENQSIIGLYSITLY